MRMKNKPLLNDSARWKTSLAAETSVEASNFFGVQKAVVSRTQKDAGNSREREWKRKRADEETSSSHDETARSWISERNSRASARATAAEEHIE